MGRREALAPGIARAQGAEVAFGGLRADTSLPVEVTADVLSVNQTDGAATFSGNVLVVQGEMRLSADRVEVIYGNAERSRIERLHASGRVTLVSGSPAPGSMFEGLGSGCDAALFVGYHARAGTAGAVLEHTWDHRTYEVRVGDLPVGEFGIAALLAGHFAVPAVYLSGDDKVVAEARALVAGIAATVVKTGIRREVAAWHAPEEARTRMRADVEAALRTPRKPAPLVWDGAPLRLTFTRVTYCDLAETCPGVVRLDGRALEMSGASFADVYRTFLACLRLAGSEG